MNYVLIIVLSSILIGLSKGGIGAVLGVLVVPLLTLVMPVAQAISVSLPLLIIADWFALWAFWKTWDMRYIKLMLPMAVVGIAVGTFLLKTLSNETLRHVLGAFTLLFIVYRLLDYRLKSLDYHPRDWHGYVAGAATGLGSALANTGAPPYTAYMLLQEVSPAVFVGTTTLLFAIINVVKLPGLVIAGLFDLHDLLAVLWAIPLIPLGVWAGRWLVVRMNKAAFERFMLFVLFVAALFLIFVPPK